jgi:ribonuclease BN (tRNA processing enzyme)
VLIFTGAYIEGSVVMMATGSLLHGGIVSFWPAYGALLLGDILSDTMWYCIGRWGGRPFLDRWGRLFNATPEVISKVERRFHEYHTSILIVSKLTMGFGFAVATLMTAGLMVESISRYKEKHGVVVGASSVIEGDYKGDRGISNYHLSNLEKHFVARAGKKLRLLIKGTPVSILPTKVRHEDKKGFGFVLEMQGKRIGYTSDTEYFKGISAQYLGCDVLIANCLKPKEDRIPGHLNTHTTARLFSEARPKLGVITHLGISLLKEGPEKNARKIRQLSGVKTIAAQDGMKIYA